MPFSSLKKHFVRSNQFLSEKLTGVKGTDKGSDYKRLTELIDAYKHYYEDIVKRVVDYLEPNPNARTKAKATNAVNKLQGSPKSETYPHAETALGNCFNNYGKALSQQPHFSSALLLVGEAFDRIGDAKNQVLDETKSGFLRPINETLNQDIKEIALLRKKAEHRRLTYDAKKNTLERTGLPPDHDFQEAQRLFEESLTISSNAMSNFLGGEAEQIEALKNFVSAQLSFYQDSARVLSDLQLQIQNQLDSARDSAVQGYCGNQFSTKEQPVYQNADEYNHLSPNVQMKPKYDHQLKQTPTCQALYDFDAESPFELSFREGDILRLIEQVDENWYLGELNGQEGHFPTNYVRVLVPLP